jgi:hypothetical protein
VGLAALQKVSELAELSLPLTPRTASLLFYSLEEVRSPVARSHLLTFIKGSRPLS